MSEQLESSIKRIPRRYAEDVAKCIEYINKKMYGKKYDRFSYEVEINKVIEYASKLYDIPIKNIKIILN